MEVSALTHKSMPGLSGPSALLRLQSDERLITMTRRGQHAAFEVLFSRYQSRLLAFCRHMLSSREDAEDVLQEVFTAAFNAVLADDREINVRPWLYRIARNRSLNHLRRASAIGVDSMDVHYADNGLSTGERVMRRESFRQLLGDVKELPETQRTALLLREIDALSYEQIADAMETTVPSVKSLLVRARISLAEAAEARQLSCDEVRLQLGEAAEGLTKLGPPARRHVRGCDRCRSFKKQLKDNNHALAAIFPVGTLLLAKKLLLTKLGSTASAGHVSAGATAGATAGAAGAGGMSGGLLTAGAGAVATKAVAGLAAAALVTAGAVAAEHATHTARHHHAAVTGAYVPPAVHSSAPVVVHAAVQSVSSEPRRFAAATAATHRILPAVHRRPSLHTPKLPTPGVSLPQKTADAPASGTSSTKPVDTSKPAPPQVTEITTNTTPLPTSATTTTPPPTPAVPAEAPSTPASDPTGGTASPPAETPPASTTPTPPVETSTPPAESAPPTTPPTGAATESTQSSTTTMSSGS